METPQAIPQPAAREENNSASNPSTSYQPATSQHGQAAPASGLAHRHGQRITQTNAFSTPYQKATATGVSWNSETSPPPGAYILSSPAGPQAILMNNAQSASTGPTPASGIHSTAVQDGGARWRVLVVRETSGQAPAQPVPQQYVQQPQQHYIQQPHAQPLLNQHLNLHMQQVQQHLPQQLHLQVQQQLQQTLLLHQQQLQQQQQQQQQQQAAQLQQQQQAAPQGLDAQANFARAHLMPNNPGAGMLAAMLPHIWLIARLLLFVWWFTSPAASWSRWATVIGLALAMFLVNTGILDGLANQAWAPIRRHLDTFVPVIGGQNGQNVPPAPGGGDAGQGAPPRREEDRNQAPNPAEAAARLVANRRNANADWLMGLIQQAERVGIMFLASLAPGVAERHVAMVEQQRQAEEDRRQREEAAAAAAAAAEAAAEAAAKEAAEAVEAGPGATAEAAGELTAEEQREEEQLRQGSAAV